MIGLKMMKAISCALAFVFFLSSLAQASLLFVEERKFIYEFDVIASDIAYDHLLRLDTDEIETDPQLLNRATLDLHPLRAAIGHSGHNVIEITEVWSHETPGTTQPTGYTSEHIEADCISGFLCDLPKGSSTDERVHIFERAHELHGRPTPTGFSYGYADDFWVLSFESSGDGFLVFDIDCCDPELFESEGIFYSTYDSIVTFQIANARSTQIIPAPVPLPASAPILLVGFGVFLTVSSRKRVCVSRMK